MKVQAFNPYLPSYEYVPDGEPHVFEGRLYVYGSHDRFNGLGFCLNDYVAWSCPIDDLGEWRYEGVIFKKKDVPPYFSDNTILWAPDVTRGKDGRYYLYFFVGKARPNDNRIRVAVSSSPAGPFTYYGACHYQDGVDLGTRKGELKSFDPAIFIDDDGKIYLYSGFGAPFYNPFIHHGWKSSKKGAMVYELADDMLTVKQGPSYIGVPAESQGTPYEGHGFFEASSLRKLNHHYYFIYSSIQGHELCYAKSDYPDHGFAYGGTLVSTGDIGYQGRLAKQADNYTGNTHGSIVEIGGHYYVFYHRQTNLNQFSRQGCAEEIFCDKEGNFAQVETTSCGLNGGPLQGLGRYEARIACNLSSKNGTKFYSFLRLKSLKKKQPYFTQEGADREENGNQYMANLTSGAWCGFKYFLMDKPSHITLSVRGNGTGRILLRTSWEGNPVAMIPVTPAPTWSDFSADLAPMEGKVALFFTYEGTGHIDFASFTLS